MAHFSDEPVATRADAAERSLRSLAQGFALDIIVAVVLVLSTAFGAIEWTPTYWKALGLTLAKSVLQAGVSYLMRMFVVPKQSTPVG
jgi:heme/copper-type cytochrome/quinol oxidase subunit 4